MVQSNTSPTTYKLPINQIHSMSYTQHINDTLILKHPIVN